MKFTLLAMIALVSGAISQTTTSEDPGPSPTASVGCEPHGDHWHCDGPASATATTSASASSSEDTTTSATPTSPSPTESVGCEPHGDHWHCDGPAETGTDSSSTASASNAAETGAADMVGAKMMPVFGLAVGAAALFV
ncbi:hypothetical protein N7533_002029 [Penicillium manginii]|uniref:uncharacterized protein n=1 Tax=Penicillium manginii TaxID=203109 RepID=UPI00254693C0|nr:uncharacterized protein N7533_002029 [Penicillium manginii]KAJ5763348.1 hypothetical protein N7533_002029 [Penicillium manginii]